MAPASLHPPFSSMSRCPVRGSPSRLCPSAWPWLRARAKHDAYLPELVPHLSDKRHASLFLGGESLPNWGEKDKLLPAYVPVLFSYTQFRIVRTSTVPWLQRGRHQSSSVKPGWESCLLTNSVGWERNSLACCCCEYSVLCKQCIQCFHRNMTLTLDLFYTRTLPGSRLPTMKSI